MVDKSVKQLRSLKENGYSNPYFGIESGDNVILEKMNKGYSADLILEQCQKMESAGFEYIVNFLNGLGGHEYGLSHARETAKIYNELVPSMIYVSSLTLMKGSRLYRLAEIGRYQEAMETEKLEEIMEFIQRLTRPTFFKAEHVSIAVPISGYIHQDKGRMIDTLQSVIDASSEQGLRRFRDSITSL
jgi:radical SAM superfamily enzyme YgiQ (UPF0313 family)